jgi:hypothetical protein
MVCFQTPNPNLGRFGRALEWKMLVYLENFTAVWYILWPFWYFRGNLLYFSRFGTFCQEKSGSPAPVAAQTYF